MKALFFDLVGTLVEPGSGIGDQYAGVARRHGVGLDAGAIEIAFAREMASTPAVQAWGLPRAEAERAERGWWRDLVQRVFAAAGGDDLLRPGRFEPFFEDLYQRFTTGDAWRLYPDVLPTLDGLKARGLVTGLVTNYDSRIYRLVESLGLAPRLDSISIPATAGAPKPARAIFAHALRGHGLAPADAAHVGDSIGDDYEGALGAGLEAVLLDRDGRHAALAGVRRARTLDEAVELLRAQG